jgi:hypothetical protein
MPLLLACFLATPLGAAQIPAHSAEHTWNHPAKTYHTSVQRWFDALPEQLQYSEVRFRAGDDLRWAQPDWDDTAWQISGFWDLPARAGIHWIRFRVRMGDDGRERIQGGVMASTVIAYEVFWDGVLVGNSGVPGMSRATEIPGRLDNWFSVPAPLLGPGEHVVAIRASSYRCGFPAAKSGIRFMVDAPEVFQERAMKEAIGPTLAAGAMFMVAMASLIMWVFAARRNALLLLAGMCGAIAAMQSLHAVRWIFHYPADWHYTALVVMKSLVGLLGFFLVAFVLVHFSLPGRWWFVGALAAAFVLVTWLSPERMNVEGVYMLAVGAGVSLVCAVWAVWQRRRDAWPSVVGISVTTLFLLLEMEDFRTNFFLKFLPATLGLMTSLALHLHDERRRAEVARLAAARLELELLKKNIQPHFLLNTLATIQETIEQEPKTAAALVEALAGEFRILSRVAGEKLIPLGQELELCRAHLRVMSLRKGVTCSLVADDVDGRSLVPPALFHTLVENGLTHLLPRDGRLDFVLRVEKREAETRYVLLAHGARQPSTSPQAKEGTGLRYIKARLEESFTGKWTLESGPVSEGWETVVEIGSADVSSAPSVIASDTSALPRKKPA